MFLKMKNRVVCLMVFLFAQQLMLGQSINLGSVANFTLYSSEGAVSNTGISNITGDIGTNFGDITGFGPPSVHNGNIQNAIALQHKQP